MYCIRPITILSNFQKLPDILVTLSTKEPVPISIETFSAGTNLVSALRIFWKTFKSDILILNVTEPLLFKLCLFKYLFPWNRCRLISVDILLTRSQMVIGRIKCRIQSILLTKVDAFILYFRDISRYSKFCGLPPEKCFYVPFKVNQLDKIKSYLANLANSSDASDGDCVMAIGRTLRDLKTFISAMERTKLPGVILRQSHSIMAEHGSIIPDRNLPENVREEIHDGNQTSFIRHIARAKAVVIPRYRWDLKSSGISTYLMAMAMGKCVIISHGPGATELLKHDEAILVPPEDPQSLAKAIQKVWHNAELRKRLAANAQKYAFSLGDETRLLEDILRFSLKVMTTRSGQA